MQLFGLASFLGSVQYACFYGITTRLCIIDIRPGGMILEYYSLGVLATADLKLLSLQGKKLLLWLNQYYFSTRHTLSRSTQCMQAKPQALPANAFPHHPSHHEQHE